MDKYDLILMAVGAAVLLVGGVYSVYQLFQLVKTDATCRGLKHPKLWGFLSISGNNSGGLLLYFIVRRKYPILSMTDAQKSAMDRCKKKFGIGLAFFVAGTIACIWGIVLMSQF